MNPLRGFPTLGLAEIMPALEVLKRLFLQEPLKRRSPPRRWPLAERILSASTSGLPVGVSRTASVSPMPDEAPVITTCLLGAMARVEQSRLDRPRGRRRTCPETVWET